MLAVQPGWWGCAGCWLSVAFIPLWNQQSIKEVLQRAALIHSRISEAFSCCFITIFFFSFFSLHPSPPLCPTRQRRHGCTTKFPCCRFGQCPSVQPALCSPSPLSLLLLPNIWVRDKKSVESKLGKASSTVDEGKPVHNHFRWRHSCGCYRDIFMVVNLLLWAYCTSVLSVAPPSFECMSWTVMLFFPHVQVVRAAAIFRKRNGFGGTL